MKIIYNLEPTEPKEAGSKYTIDELIKEGILEDITESVKDGRIEIE